jgi:uncharacterized protein YegJ (DUF2314 family)
MTLACLPRHPAVAYLFLVRLMKTTLLALAFTITAAFAQTADYSKTPKDKPASVTDALEKAIQPYVTQGRRTYPAAKKRFIAGLPPKYIFSVTTKLYDHLHKTFEIVFVGVDSIKNGRVTGWLATHTQAITNYHYRDRVSFPESDVLDWTIVSPDGTEEGNVVGKFIDKWKPR